jgi:20S proteasome alpha/beta subunit
MELDDERDDCLRQEDWIDILPRETTKVTLALAFIGKDGIVMATDSAQAYLNSVGEVVRTVCVQKLHKLGRYTGLAEVGQQAGVSEWMIYRFNVDKEHKIAKLDYADMVKEFT